MIITDSVTLNLRSFLLLALKLRLAVKLSRAARSELAV